MVDLYNVQDGLTGRDGGPYLDQVERERAEDLRAKAEGREPNYETMGGYAGTVYATAAQLLATESLNNVPSQFEQGNAAKEKAVAALVADSDVNLVVAFAAPDVPEDDGMDSVERQEKNDKLLAAQVKKTAAKKTTAKPTSSDPFTTTK